MQNSHNKILITVKPGFLIVLAISLLLLPIKFVCAWLIAVFIHELSHLIMLLALKLKIHAIGITATGVRINTAPAEPWQELLCASAGPLGGLFLGLFIRITPVISLFAIIQSCINLIPIGERDGACILRCLIIFCSKGKVRKNSLQTTATNSTISAIAPKR